MYLRIFRRIMVINVKNFTEISVNVKTFVTIIFFLSVRIEFLFCFFLVTTVPNFLVLKNVKNVSSYSRNVRIQYLLQTDRRNSKNRFFWPRKRTHPQKTRNPFFGPSCILLRTWQIEKKERTSNLKSKTHNSLIHNTQHTMNTIKKQLNFDVFYN